MNAFLWQALAFIEASKYLLFALGSFIEGSGVMLAGGFLLRLGEVSFWPLFAALYIGDIASDTLLYIIGYFGARRIVDRWGAFFSLTPAIVAKMEKRFHRYHAWILIISKLTMGFGFAYATLLTAGMLRVPFSRYFLINGIGGLIWIPFVIGVGYVFGDITQKIPSDLRIAFVIVWIILIALFVRWVKSQLSKID